jgi:hypothetical protein
MANHKGCGYATRITYVAVLREGEIQLEDSPPI